MTTPKKPVPPGKPMKKLSRFVTDTLFFSAGGPVPVNRSFSLPPDVGQGSSAVWAGTYAPRRPQQGDTAIVFFKPFDEGLMAHEMGHVIDHRNLIPEILADVAARRVPFPGNPRTQDEYARSSRDEYVAEAFARAIKSGRKGFTDSTKVEREFPGAIKLIRWLRTRPPFTNGDSTHRQKVDSERSK